MKRTSVRSLVVAAVLALSIALATPGAFAFTVCNTGTPDFATVAAAVTDANTNFPAGGATYNVCAGHTETAPAGGYVLTSQGTAGSPIIFQKSGAGTNPTITASGALVAGSLNDGIFKIVGGDFITIDGFTLQENPANATTAAATNNMTEWGVALLYASTTNGAQNNTIQNSTITLNRSYTNSFGVYSNTRHSATAPTTTADITDATTGPNHGNRVYGNTISNVNMGITFIGSGTAANQDVGNDIGGASVATGNTLTNWGGAAAASSFISNSGTSYGILVNHQKGENVSFNSLTSAAVSGTSVAFRGIFKDYTATAPTGTFTSSITNNTVTMSSGFTSGTFEAIRSQGMTALSTATINITNNSILNCVVSGLSSSSAIVGIVNSSVPGVLSISNNVFRGHTSTATTGGMTGVQNTGAVVTTVNLNSNNIGDGTAGAITFSAATSGAVIGVSNTGGATTATVNINSNNIRGIVHAVTGSSSHTYIQQTAANPSTNIGSNTFTNLTLATTGSVTFMTNNVTHAASTTHNVTSNSIVTAFSKTGAGGTVRCYDSFGTSPTSVTETSTGNNFSNITVTGATTIDCWRDADGSTTAPAGPRKTVTGNTFSNITGGTSAITLLTVSFSDTTFAGNNVSGNTISNVASAGSITGLTFGTLTGAGNHNFTNNTISGLSSSGASAVIVGMSITGGTTQNVSGNTISGLAGSGITSPVATGLSVTSGTTVTLSKNKIYDISQSGAITTTSPAINGLLLSGGTTVNAQNNYIGDLRAPAAGLTDAIRGISVTSATALTTYNVFYNTLWMNAPVSSGTNFGTTGVFHTASATSTTGQLNLRNNIIVNTSFRAGTGLTVAYRRSSSTAGTLANYGTTSNNNDFYAGTPGANNVIYYNGTTAGQTISDYKGGVFTEGTVSPRDTASFTENPNFLSTTGSSSSFLHINPSFATQIESGAVNIAGITDDYDGEVRQGNGGYAGTGTAPDTGADEFEGTPIDLQGPVITYTAFGNTTSTANRFLAVTVTDGSGVPTAGTGLPRIYFRKGSSDPYSIKTCVSNGGSSYTCEIDYTLVTGGVVTTGDLVQYFVVAQDTAGNVSANPSAGAAGFTANPPAVSTPPTTPNSYVIATAIAGSINVGTGETITSLTNAGGIFEFINNNVVAGNTTINITSNLTAELGTVALNQTNEQGAGNWTITFQSSAATVRTISGAVANGMVRLSGADRITFDGRVGGTGNFLLFRNTNTSNPAITFLNDATANTLESCTIEGGNTSLLSGTVLFSTSTGTLGNSGNTIHLCDIRDRTDAAGVPANGVYSSGSAGAPNGTNTISGCNIFNWTNAGVLVSATGAGNGWVVNPSHFYQTAARTTAMTGIAILGGSGHSVLNNSIGGTAPGAGGANLATTSSFRGIDLAVGTASPTSVQGNVVKNIRSTVTGFTASYGIFLQSGLANIGNVTGNTIGSATVGERYEINGDSFGIRVISTSTVNLSNNTINNFGTNATPSLGEFYFGASVEGTGGSHTIVNNTITNVTNASVPDGTSFDTRTFGLIVTATGAQTIRGNTISNIGSTSVTAPTSLNNRIWGLVVSGAAAGTVVEKNVITNIFGSSAGAGARVDIVSCLQSEGTSNATYSNNMVSTAGGSGASDRLILGILDLSTTAGNYYFNSVNITGTATAANNSYAFNRNGTATVTLRNNVFADTRSGGTGFHVAMANTNASATGWSATASNNNVLFNAAAGNITQWLGSALANNRTLGAFQTDTGGDAASLSGDPQFFSPTNLHINTSGGPSPVENAGVTFGGITTDIDGDSRGPVPDVGADEVIACAGVICGGFDTDCATSSCNPDGLSGNCSVLTAHGGTCRAATDLCDAAEVCDGVNTGACPADGFATSGVCRAASDLCDVAESCNGSGPACPADGFATSGECRPVGGACDVAESCNGSGPACPADGFATSGECRGVDGVCDVAESCDGSGPDCPSDGFVTGGECRASSGELCDPAESCDGSGADCPPDVVNASEPVGNTVRGSKPGGVPTYSWPTETSPGPFNVYRGSLVAGSTWAYNQACFATGLVATSVPDPLAPAQSTLFYYLVSRQTPPCSESNLGQDSNGNDRPNGNACPNLGADTDGDVATDEFDNCPTVANASQVDLDADNHGDACDNCPANVNPTQGDVDFDGLGDACDPDIDNDGVANGSDNCPTIANPGQEDGDFNTIGDACDD